MRGMNGMLILKEKDDKRVVYRYSADTSTFGGKAEDVVVDGEIECVLAAKEFRTLKTATNDDDGGQAEWLYAYLPRVIFKENCPAKRFIATG
jgi:hypothetical protein